MHLSCMVWASSDISLRSMFLTTLVLPEIFSGPWWSPFFKKTGGSSHSKLLIMNTTKNAFLKILKTEEFTESLFLPP